MNSPQDKTSSCLALLAGIVLTFGCSQQIEEEEKGPSYADLVVIYTSEHATLERLYRKREALVKKHEEELRPSPTDALELLGSALNSPRAEDLAADPNDVLDPNAMLDQAVEDAQKYQDAASNLLDSLAGDPVEDEEELKRREELTEEFQRELKSLDEEIEKQQARVDRALQKRDAAEAEAAGK